MNSALSRSLIIYPPTECLDLPPTFFCMCVCVGEEFLTLERSPEANQVLTWKTLGRGVPVTPRCIQEMFQSLLIHRTADIYRKTAEDLQAQTKVSGQRISVMVVSTNARSANLNWASSRARNSSCLWHFPQVVMKTTLEQFTTDGSTLKKGSL